MKRAPLEIQISRKINETRTPKFWRDGLYLPGTEYLLVKVVLLQNYDFILEDKHVSGTF